MASKANISTSLGVNNHGLPLFIILHLLIKSVFYIYVGRCMLCIVRVPYNPLYVHTCQ